MMSNLKSIWLLCPKSGKAKVFCRGHLNCQSCLWTSHKFSPSLHNAEEKIVPPLPLSYDASPLDVFKSFFAAVVALYLRLVSIK